MISLQTHPMKNRGSQILALVALASLACLTGCAKRIESSAPTSASRKHEHKPPHGGTPVVLGKEVYHIEFVLDAADGKLQAYIFDGEMENFIRSALASFEVNAVVNGAPQSLLFRAVANAATGETVGDTALFEAQADWLKSANEFDGRLKSITIRGSTFDEVKFNFPKGNDQD